MDWACRYLPWVLDKLSDDEYTARVDEIENLDNSILNGDYSDIRKAIIAKYFLHFASLSSPTTHPNVFVEILDSLKNLSPKVPWNLHQMSDLEVIDAYVELGDIYA